MNIGKVHSVFYVLMAAIVLLSAALGFSYYKYAKLSSSFLSLSADFETSQKNLTEKSNTLDYILQKFNEEQAKTNAFSEDMKYLLEAYGNLDKLTKTDKELLQKYSKVYFLNEHYVPEKLVSVPEQYLVQPKKNIQVHEKVWPFLERLFAAANESGNPLQVISGYRSFDEQNSLKDGYKVTYGAGTANAFSADQGYSEHQLGTTLDFSTPDLGISFEEFKDTQAYNWLENNAHVYGFTLSYPRNNDYYVFEPWHWRFVGVKLATYLHNEGKNFYDIDQRAIDGYLVNIFD